MTAPSPVQPHDLFFASTVEGCVASPRFMRRDWLAAEVADRLAAPACRLMLLSDMLERTLDQGFIAALSIRDERSQTEALTPLLSGKARAWTFDQRPAATRAS